MNNYIGLLDSGVGGLSVLAELYKVMPDRNYIFFGDTKNIPYGTKTKSEIMNFTSHILKFFIKKNVKYVVVACNTTSALVYEELKEKFKNELKIFPLIQSAAKDSIKDLKGNKIAVFATKATVNSHKYKEEIQKIDNNVNVIEIDCSGFVEIVENRLYHDLESLDLIKSKLDIVKGFGAKRVIMGCTHYPYLENIFKNILDVEYFNPAKSVINIVEKETDESVFGNNLDFYVSKDPEQFILSAKPFFKVECAHFTDMI